MTGPHSYRYTFDDCGGYDCMYGAYTVYGPGDAVLFDIDLRHYGQKPCDFPIPPDVMAEGEAVAKRVVDLLNGSSHATNGSTK
jgi:hypothetical protein